MPHEGRAAVANQLYNTLIRAIEQERKQRELEDRERNASLEFEQRLTTERMKLVEAAEQAARARFEVEDFVPQKLKVELAAKAPAYAPGDEVQIDVNARFLYGAPASDLATEAEATIEFDPEPYPQLPGFLFGHEREKADFPPFPLTIPNTDAQGRAVASGSGALSPSSTMIRSSVWSGG